MFIGNYKGSNYAYINWANLPTINGTITRGFLSFNFFPGTTTWGGVDLNRPAYNWDSYNIRWHNKPSNIWLYSWLEPKDWKGYKNFDLNVTETIKGWYNQGGFNYGRYGFSIKYSDESYNDYNTIISSDSGYASEFWPCIYINYEPNTSGGGQTTEDNYLSLKWQYPLENSYKTVTQDFSSSHPAIDIYAPCGRPIYATENGTVIYKKDKDDTAGNWISIRSNSLDPISKLPIVYNYMHLSESALKSTNQTVTKGEIIGYVGKSGNATGCHLHIETYGRPNGSTLGFGAQRFPNSQINPRSFYNQI